MPHLLIVCYKENVSAVVAYNIIHISNVILHNKHYNVLVILSLAMAADMVSDLHTIGQLVSLARFFLNLGKNGVSNLVQV